MHAGGMGEVLHKKIVRMVSRNVPLSIANNGKYSVEKVMDLFVQAAMDCTSVEDKANKNRLPLAPNKYPSGDTVLYHLEKLTPTAILKSFRRTNGLILGCAKVHGLLSGRKNLALDRTEVEYYGRVRDKWVVGGKHRNGTSYFYKFSTIDIVEDGRRFTLDICSHTQFSETDEEVRYLIGSASSWVSINTLFGDRAFAKIKTIRLLKDMGTYFVFALQTDSRLKPLSEERYRKSDYIFDHTMGSKKDNVEFTVFLVDNPKYDVEEACRIGKRYRVKRFHLFATNLPVVQVRDDQWRPAKALANPYTRQIQAREKLADDYGSRWGIETDYRVEKNGFLAATTSNNYTVRLFYFCLSVLLRNFWELSKSIYGEDLDGIMESGYLSTEIWKELYLNDVRYSSYIATISVLASFAFRSRSKEKRLLAEKLGIAR